MSKQAPIMKRSSKPPTYGRVPGWEPFVFTDATGTGIRRVLKRVGVPAPTVERVVRNLELAAADALRNASAQELRIGKELWFEELAELVNYAGELRGRLERMSPHARRLLDLFCAGPAGPDANPLGLEAFGSWLQSVVDVAGHRGHRNHAEHFPYFRGRGRTKNEGLYVFVVVATDEWEQATGRRAAGRAFETFLAAAMRPIYDQIGSRMDSPKPGPEIRDLIRRSKPYEAQFSLDRSKWKESGRRRPRPAHRPEACLYCAKLPRTLR